MKRQNFLSLQIYGAILGVVIVGAFIALGFFQFRSLAAIDEDMQQYVKESEDWGHAQADFEAVIGFDGLIHHFKDYIIRQEQKYYDEAKEDYQTAVELGNRLKELPHFTQEAVFGIDAVLRTMEIYINKLDNIKDLIASGANINELDLAVLVDDSVAIQGVKTIDEEFVKFAEHEKRALEDALRAAFFQIVFVLSGIFALSFIILFFIMRSVSKEIDLIIDTTREMSKGNLTISVPVQTKDVIGKLSQNFNVAIESFRKTIFEVKSSINNNEKAGKELAVQIDETLSSTTQISASINSMMRQIQNLSDEINASSTAVEEILANIKSLVQRIEDQAGSVTETSAAIEEMSASINNVANIAQEKRISTTNLVAITSDGNEKIINTNEQINEVSASFDDIISMNSVINNIAAQTNLLAMNAAIEAAHAGDAGKGFAVVADEIRNLAETTSKNSKEISGTLKQLMEKIQTALSSSSASGSAFEAIKNSVNDVANAFDEISASTTELSNGSDEILSATTSLLNISEEIRNGSNEMESGAEGINSALLNIKQIAEQTNASIVEINGGAEDISRATMQISDLSSENMEQFSALLKSVQKFAVEEQSS